MKNILFILAGAVLYFSCSKKETVSPATTNTVIQHDTVKTTVTVIKHDTVYCTPKSDIIQGTWYCYAYQSYHSNGSSGYTDPNITSQTPSQEIIFTNNSMNWNGSTATASFSSDFSSIYINGGISPYYLISIYNCTDIKLLAYNGVNNGSGPTVGSIYYLRRTP